MSARPPHNLPAALTRLIGRERDVAAVGDVLVNDGARLVTLTGIGGSGKTRLALGVGDHLLASFPGGVWFVPLDSISDEDLVPQAIAEPLGLTESGGQSLLTAVTNLLRREDALLILDNCEHLIEATASITLQLLSDCPDLRVLATSREPLQIAGERRYPVDPLQVPDPTGIALSEELMWFPAIRLFVDRAQSVVPGFQLTQENAADVVSICTRLEGIPLAIELAAARTQSLTCGEILKYLEDGSGLLRGTQRDRPRRQQTLAATLDWSYDLLTPEEQAVFRSLSVFADGCELAAIATIVSGQTPSGESDTATGEILDILSQLVDRSLVTVHQSRNSSRYRLLEPVRQYTSRLLKEAGAYPVARAAHAEYFLAFAETAAVGLQGARQDEWITQLYEEEDNMRLALRWFEENNQAVSLMRLTIALFYFWEFAARLAEGRGWLQAAIDAASDVPDMVPPERAARAMRNAGRLAYMQRDVRSAEDLFEQSLHVSRESHDRVGIAASLTGLSLVSGTEQDHDRAESCSDQAVALARELGNQPLLAFSLLASGKAAYERGDLQASRVQLGEALSLYQTVGDRRQRAVVTALLGASELDARDYDSAAGHLGQALAIHHRNGDRWFVIYTLINIARLLAENGQQARASTVLGAVRGLERDLGEVVAPIGARVVEQLVKTLELALDRDEIDRAVAEGATLPCDEAVALALEATERLELSSDAPPVTDEPETHGVERLTRREREVAALVALGYSDRQIAEELFISPATVGVHVHHILGKLQIRSRWQVAERVGQQNSPDTTIGNR